MKVLFFVDSLTGGGAERVVAVLSKYLVEQGFEVCVATMHWQDRDFFRTDERVARVSLGLAGRNRGVGKLFATFNRIRALRGVVRSQNADVVVGMKTTSAVFTILACIGLRSRVIVSERNYPVRKSTDTPWRILRWVFYRFAAAHVAQTRETADWLHRRVSARNVHVVPNSVAWPVPGGSPRLLPDEILDRGVKIILAVGSKVEQKGFDLLLSAFARAAETGSGWHAVILGLEGPSDPEYRQRDSLRRQAASLGIEDRVHFPGRAGNIAEWYQRADIFVLSSRYEGFPNVLLEALAAGCASVSFDCDTGPRDIIEHGVNGLLLPPENCDALAASIRTLMDDPRLREQLGENARSVRDRYSERRVLGVWKDIIEELVA